LTPEETALILKALDIDQNIQIYIAAGEIFGGERRMARLRATYPNLVGRKNQNHISTCLFIYLCVRAFVCNFYLVLRNTTGKEGNAAGTIGLDVFPKPLLANGCIGLSCVSRE
jgi:hypothetical protein